MLVDDGATLATLVTVATGFALGCADAVTATAVEGAFVVGGKAVAFALDAVRSVAVGGTIVQATKPATPASTTTKRIAATTIPVDDERRVGSCWSANVGGSK